VSNYPDGLSRADLSHIEGETCFCWCGHELEDHEDQSDDGDGELTCIHKGCDCEGFKEYTKEDAEADKADLGRED